MARKTLGLLRGSRAISRFLHDDETHWREIPALAEAGYPIFKMLGKWTAVPDSLAQEIAAREARARAEAGAVEATTP